MYVEDILVSIARTMLMSSKRSRPFGGLLDDKWSHDFLINVSQYVHAGHALSSKQSQMILKLIGRVRSHLPEAGIISSQELDRLLAKPEYRHTPYESSNSKKPREARYLGNNLLGLSCKVDSLLIERIKAIGNSETHEGRFSPRSPLSMYWSYRRPRFNWLHRLWIVPVHRSTLKAIKELLHYHRFQLDRATMDYLHLCEQSRDQSSIFSQTDDENIWFCNVRDNHILASWVTEVAGGVVL